MSKRTIKATVVGGVGLLIVADVFLASDRTKKNTISHVIREASDQPMVPFSFGMLMGHWFWTG